MSDSSSIIPISDEQAKAIKAAIDALSGMGNFLRDVLGTVPADLVGYFGGDWLKVRRAENAAKILQKAQERLNQKGVKAERPSLAVALPILIAGADEDREELQDVWARLLATAMDPTQSKLFRIAFVEIVKKMDPLDVGALEFVVQNPNAMQGAVGPILQGRFKVSGDEAFVSVQHLYQLGLVEDNPGTTPWPRASSMGRLLVRALS